MNNETSEIAIEAEFLPSRKKMLTGLGVSFGFFILAFTIGVLTNGWAATSGVVFPGLILEVFVAALASIPLGFDPFSGALIAALSNMALAPFLIVSLDLLIYQLPWLNKRIKKAERISKKYGKYGVWILAPLAPFIGVLVAIAVGAVLRFRTLPTFISVTIGITVAAFLTTYGGDEIRSLLFK